MKAATFWTRMTITKRCWLWEGAVGGHGYGTVRRPDGTYRSAHRHALELDLGVTIPSNLDVCHRCDVKTCCRPSHLFVGTRADNMQDAKRKGRMTPPPRTTSESALKSAATRRARGWTHPMKGRHYG